MPAGLKPVLTLAKAPFPLPPSCILTKHSAFQNWCLSGHWLEGHQSPFSIRQHFCDSQLPLCSTPTTHRPLPTSHTYHDSLYFLLIAATPNLQQLPDSWSQLITNRSHPGSSSFCRENTQITTATSQTTHAAWPFAAVIVVEATSTAPPSFLSRQLCT